MHYLPFAPLCESRIWRWEFLKGSCSVVSLCAEPSTAEPNPAEEFQVAASCHRAAPGSCFSLCLSGHNTEMWPFLTPLRCGNILVQSDLTSLHGGNGSHAHASVSFKTSLVSARINPHVCCFTCLLKLCT